MELGNYSSAISNLELVCDGARNHLLYYMLGEAYQADEQIDKAIGAYLKATMLNEKFALAYKKLGILFLGRGDKVSAVEYFEDYLELDIPEEEKEQARQVLNRIK
jgi:tetratricopeptide (TPR) repeat protein